MVGDYYLKVYYTTASEVRSALATHPGFARFEVEENERTQTINVNFPQSEPHSSLKKVEAFLKQRGFETE